MEPQKAAPAGRVTVVFPEHLYKWLDAVSDQEDRPIANMVRYMVRRYLQQEYRQLEPSIEIGLADMEPEDLPF